MIECTMCSNCCRYMLITPKVNYEGNENWLAYHRVGLVNGKLKIPISCVMLKDNKCSIYEMRPKACKDAAVGSIPECKAREASNGRKL